jgi:hypothetical protein
VVVTEVRALVDLPVAVVVLPVADLRAVRPCTSRVALASRSSEFVAYAEAVLTKSPSLQPGCAFAVICTVTWLPAPSVGDVT